MTTNQPLSPKSLVLRVLLSVLLCLTIVRLIGFIMRFAGESLQMDFAAFYTAGETIQAGLSPYITYPDHAPPLWDGVNRFQHSRFLYPPLVATLFQPIVWLSYFQAKLFWMVLSLVCLISTLWLINHCFHLERQPISLLLFGILTTTYYPLLTYLERGQIDTINLLLLTLAILQLLRPHHQSQMGAGLLIALATLLKLHCIYFVPFLLWRRQWWAVAGYGMGGSVLLLLSLWLNGPTILTDYVRTVLPRISQYGDLGPVDLYLPDATWATLQTAAPEGYTAKDGRIYLPESFYFTKNATMVRNLHSILNKRYGPLQYSTVSLFTFLALFLLLLGWTTLVAPPVGLWHERHHFFYWETVMLIILLAGPMTWLMNLVWLLPLAFALFAELPTVATREQSIALAFAFLGLLITALPDGYTFAMLAPFGQDLLRWQYIFAELLIFIALLFYWKYSFTESKLALASVIGQPGVTSVLADARQTEHVIKPLPLNRSA